MHAGKHVLIEKPMALTVRQADEVIEAAGKYGVRAGVVSQHRFSPSLIALRAAVDGGRLGKIATADVIMKYYRSPEYYRQSRWRGTWAMDGGGALMNQGIHGVDTLMFVAGDVVCVSAATRTLAHDIEVEDTAAAVVEFKCGALGLIQGATSTWPGYPRRLSVSGTRGTVTVCEQLIEQWDVEGDAPPAHLRLGGDQVTGASDPNQLDESGHLMQIADLADAIRDRRDPAVALPDARRAIELIEGIYRSARGGERIWMEGYER
jgi:predicted dehydrogenase